MQHAKVCFAVICWLSDGTYSYCTEGERQNDCVGCFHAIVKMNDFKLNWCEVRDPLFSRSLLIGHFDIWNCGTNGPQPIL